MIGEATILSYFLVFLIKKSNPVILYKLFFPIRLNIPYPINLSGVMLIAFGLILNFWANYTLLVIKKIGLIDNR